MRIAILAALLLTFCLSNVSAASSSNWNKLVFSDGQARTVADFEGQTTAVFAFCRG